MAILTFWMFGLAAFFYLAGAMLTHLFFGFDDKGDIRQDWARVGTPLRVLVYIAWPALVVLMVYVTFQMKKRWW